MYLFFVFCQELIFGGCGAMLEADRLIKPSINKEEIAKRSFWRSLQKKNMFEWLKKIFMAPKTESTGASAPAAPASEETMSDNLSGSEPAPETPEAEEEASSEEMK